jgi:hypothetical protein
MNKLAQIQNAGPADKTPAGYNRWYSSILAEANKMRRISGIGAVSDEESEESETVGNWNPLTREWEGGRHRKIIDLTAEVYE